MSQDFLVYCWTNLINGKKYVGSDSRGGQRKEQHLGCIARGCIECHDCLLHRAIRKYSEENFSYEILESDFDSRLGMLTAEQAWIEELDSFTPKGYNIRNALRFKESLNEPPDSDYPSERFEMILDYLPPTDDGKRGEYGTQIIKVRHRTQQDHPLPQNFMSDRAVQELLLLVFPRLGTSKVQHKCAARWAAVIYLHCRVGMNREHVAAELGVTHNVIHCTLKGIRRVLAGCRADNTGLKGQRRPGRPRKCAIPPEQLSKEERKEIPQEISCSRTQ